MGFFRTTRIKNIEILISISMHTITFGLDDFAIVEIYHRSIACKYQIQFDDVEDRLTTMALIDDTEHFQFHHL